MELKIAILQPMLKSLVKDGWVTGCSCSAKLSLQRLLVPHKEKTLTCQWKAMAVTP